MDMTENEPQIEDEVNEDELSWRVHPAAERPAHGALLIGIIAICTWIFWSGFGPYYGVFCLAVLLVSMAPFFLPTSYSLDDEGVEITSLLIVRHFRPWTDFRSFYADKTGVQLSPFQKPSRLAVFRGNFMRFSPENREQVKAFLDEHIKQRRIAEKTGIEA
jgi:hypothetical protein